MLSVSRSHVGVAHADEVIVTNCFGGRPPKVPPSLLAKSCSRQRLSNGGTTVGQLEGETWILGFRGLRFVGIGLHAAEAFEREGARVHVCDIDRDALAAFAAAHPDIGTSECDVGDRRSVAAMFESAVAQLDGLDCLVNNAGIAGPTGRVHEINPEDWDRCIEVCLTSQFNCARLGVDHLMKSDNASIINLSSAAGKFGFRNRSAYSAAKWGVIGFTKSIARELGPHGIRCNAILPAWSRVIECAA